MDIPIPRTPTLDLLKRMISIESVNPSLESTGSGEKECAEFLGKFMEEMGLKVHYQNLGENRANVIGVYTSQGKGPSLMLNGHIDTVNIGNMTIPPLAGNEQEGKIYGRGAIDMKSGVCAQIMALKSLLDAGIQPGGDIIIACVADEEYESMGSEALVKAFSADAAIVTEPTDLEIAIAHKGFVWSRLKVTGKAAHGSRPDQGIDAIVQMGKFLAKLEELDQSILVHKQHPLLGRASIHASVIKGGEGISIYPSECSLELERRTLPGENLSIVHHQLQEILDSLHRSNSMFTGELENFFERSPLETPKDSPIVQSATRAWVNEFHKPPEYKGVSFWADSAILADAGIPTVLFGPKGDGLHAAVEYVESDSVVSCAKVLAQTIVDFCGIRAKASENRTENEQHL